MNFQEPTCYDNSDVLGWLLDKVGADIQLPVKVRFGGTKFDRGWTQLTYGSSMLLCGTHKLLVIIKYVALLFYPSSKICC